MTTIDQQITEIETEIRKTPYHKGTERHIGILKAKIAKLKAQREAAAIRGSSGRGIAYAVKKQGDATVVLVGPPSAGKSTLINALTNAQSRVAPYAFTTVSVIPGIMNYNNAYIQILDVPGLIEGAEEGKGRGKEVLSVVRGADLLILITDISRPEAIARIAKSLEKNGIRINKNRPKVKVVKRLNGGISVHTNFKNLDIQTIKDIVSEMGHKNADVYIQEEVDIEKLIDGIAKNRVYISMIKVLNKADESPKRPIDDAIYISADKNIGLDNLRSQMWKMLNLTKIYLLKPEDDENNTNENQSMIVSANFSLFDVSQKIGSEFMEGKSKAKIWGPGSKFPGQIVSLETKVQEGMKIRFV